MRFPLLLLFIVSSQLVIGQITVPASTLPAIGDVLMYEAFVNYDVDTNYRMDGANLSWTFGPFSITGSTSESYLDINDTNLADTFPDANMAVSVAGFPSAAIRTDTSIEVIGLSVTNFSGFGISAVTQFNQPYTFKQAPIKFEDELNDEFDVIIQFPSDLIPGLDTVDVSIPGTTLDSIRITVHVAKSEQVSAWGQIHLLNGTHDVLKVTQIDEISTTIEVGLSNIFGFFWLDATALLPDLGLNSNSTTYKFLGTDSKESIVEFQETTIQDTIMAVTGRIRGDLITSIKEFNSVITPISVVPNPTNGSFALFNSDNLFDAVDVSVFNMHGQRVAQLNEYKMGSTLYVGQLPRGVYSILGTSASEYFVSKIILK